MPEECLFCRIAGGQMGTEFLHEDDRVIAFKDINPQAPTHVLVVPRRHLDRISDLEASDEALAGHLVTVANAVAKTLALSSYRLVLNCGADAGQSVFHIHLHLLGGRPMRWPPW